MAGLGARGDTQLGSEGQCAQVTCRESERSAITNVVTQRQPHIAVFVSVRPPVPENTLDYSC